MEALIPPCTSPNSLAPATISFASCRLFLALCPAKLQPLSSNAFARSRLDHCSSILVGLPLALIACLDRVLRCVSLGAYRNILLFQLICATLALNCSVHLL